MRKYKMLAGLALLVGAVTLSTRLTAVSSSPAACTLVSNAIADSNSTICYAEPDSYKTKLYKLGLCRAEPGAPTGSTPIDLGNCVTVFEDAAGYTVSVIKGQSSSLPAGKITAPPAGNYTHGYVVISPSFEIAGTFTFESNRKPRYSGSGTGTGTKCWTKQGAAYSYDVGRNDMPFDCGSTVGVAGAVTSNINSFDGLSQSYTFQRVGTDGTHKAYLVTSDLKLASSAGQGTLGSGATAVDRLVGIAPLPATITGGSQTIDLSFQKSIGASIVPDSVVGGVRTLYGIYSGPPTLALTLR